MAKLDRAQTHIDRLAELVADFFSDSAAYMIDYEPGDGNETHLRITEAKTLPVEVSTVLGDAVHNLRSSLDTVAYELARLSHGGTLTTDLEPLPEFPIRDSAKGYVDFFAGRRTGLFDEKAEEAVRSVVPGHRFDALAAIDDELIMTFQREVVLDPLWQLHRLSIIDKHRRLSLVALWPDVYWLNRDGQDSPDWRWGSPPFTKGAILGTLIGGTLPDRADLTATMEMRLHEPSVFSTNMSIVALTQRFADYIRGTALPRIWHFY
jgi:hypothetical protein